jgi:hypothetical protein
MIPTTVAKIALGKRRKSTISIRNKYRLSDGLLHHYHYSPSVTTNQPGGGAARHTVSFEFQ